MAEAPTVAEFKARFARLGTDAAIQTAIDDAYDLIGSTGKRAVIFGAAHFLSLASSEAVDGGDGEVRSTTVGSRNEMFQTMAERGDEAFWTTTRYGRMALKLCKASFARSMPVIG